MTPVAVRVRPVPLAAILGLRHAVLRPGRPPETARFDGDDDADTVHLAAVVDGSGTVVGCATLMRRPFADHPAWQLRGMATQPDLTRRGIGTAVLHAAERFVHDRGGPPLLWCNARLAAVPFYASAGWQVVSPAFDIPGIGPHHVMVRRLTRDGPVECGA
jgi:GNAT superfamily N-acetyltransferase